MTNKNLDRFGETLIRQVRDTVISDWDRIISGEQMGDLANEIRNVLSSSKVDVTTVLREVIPKLVDSTLHQMLQTVEEDQAIDILISTDRSTGTSVRDASDGLAGELYGRRGWIARFSQQRHSEL